MTIQNGPGPSGPGEEELPTSQGHARNVFWRALERGNLIVAEATAKEIGQISLSEALELTVLIAKKDARRHPRDRSRPWQRRMQTCR
jgi:hypothetical protein